MNNYYFLIDTRTAYLHCLVFFIQEKKIKIVADEKFLIGKFYNEQIASTVSKFFSDFNININLIDCFIACNGFGSFTSIRVGGAFIKGLAFDKKYFGFDYSQYLNFIAVSQLNSMKNAVLCDIGRKMPVACFFDGFNSVRKPLLIDESNIEILLDYNVFSQCDYSFIKSSLLGDFINSESLVDFLCYDNNAFLVDLKPKYLENSYAEIPKKSKYYVNLNER